MRHSDFSLEIVPGVRQRRKIETAHRETHRASEGVFEMPKDKAVKLGQVLTRSPVMDHQFDSGWLEMHAAWQTTDEERDYHFNRAGSAFRAVRDLSPDRSERIRAMMALAFLPTFRKVAIENLIYTEDLMERILKVNRYILSWQRLCPETVGVSNELAVIALLNRHTHFGESDLIAWPTTPWQDNHYGPVNRSSNYDVAYGGFVDITSKIQVKSSLEPDYSKDMTDALDSDELEAWWKNQYASDISIIFGDVHLGNNGSLPLEINLALDDGGLQAKHQALDTATRNILDEIS